MRNKFKMDLDVWVKNAYINYPTPITNYIFLYTFQTVFSQYEFALSVHLVLVVGFNVHFASPRIMKSIVQNVYHCF